MEKADPQLLWLFWLLLSHTMEWQYRCILELLQYTLTSLINPEPCSHGQKCLHWIVIKGVPNQLRRSKGGGNSFHFPAWFVFRFRSWMSQICLNSLYTPEHFREQNNHQNFTLTSFELCFESSLLKIKGSLQQVKKRDTEKREREHKEGSWN